MNEQASALPPEPIGGSPIRTSVLVDALSAALVEAHGEMEDPVKNKTASVKTRAGDVYEYTYADLADLLKIARPVLRRNGLALFQASTTPIRGAVVITTRIMHKSGQWIEFDLIMPVGDDKPQTLGSMITYGRRYAAGGALGVSPDADEDGNLGQQAKDQRGGKQQQQGNGSGPDRTRQQAKDARHAAAAETKVEYDKRMRFTKACNERGIKSEDDIASLMVDFRASGKKVGELDAWLADQIAIAQQRSP